MSSTFHKPTKNEILNELKDYLRNKYNLTDKEIKAYVREEAVKETTVAEISSQEVPINIFTDSISPLEAIVKFLKENKGLKLVDIAKLTGRDQRAIGVTYRAAVKKMPEQYVIDEVRYTVPANMLQDKKLSVAEHVVKQLKEAYQLNYHEVAVLIKRDDRTVWTLYKRAIKKMGAPEAI